MSAADSAAWVSAVGTVAAALFTAAAFGAAAWAALIARGAASTWRGVHEHAKADECVAAAYDLAHAVSRTMDERRRLENTERAPATPPPFPGEAYDAAWAAWRRLQLAHVVAFRYHAGRMDREAPARLAKLLDELKEWCAAAPQDMSRFGIPDDGALRNVDRVRADAIKARVRSEAEAIDAALMPVRTGSEVRKTS